MGFKINSKNFVPEGEPSVPEMADFCEIKALLDGHGYSLVSLQSALGISGDDELNQENGDDDSHFLQVEEVLREIDDRLLNSANNYPFQASRFGLDINPNCDRSVKEVYTFLLLATRVNMNQMKVQDGINATDVFERLSAVIIQHYWGDSAQAFVIGTGADENHFKNKVEQAIEQIGEPGTQFRWPDGSTKQEKDGNVDVIAFIPFADNRKGRFIAMGQCKTGTNWRSSISENIPKAFVDDYISPPFTFSPVPLFFVAESFYDNWETLQRYSTGILFDRCRLMQYLPQSIEQNLIQDITQWNQSIFDILAP